MIKLRFLFLLPALFFPFSALAAELPEIAVSSAAFKQNGDILLTAKNVGTLKTAAPVIVEAYWFDDENDFLSKTEVKTVASVDINVFSQITIAAQQIPKKAARAVFYADPSNEIKEVNEWNNEFNFVFPVAKFEATTYSITNGDIAVTVKNVGGREYSPESCTFCIGKKFARVVWRSADALQDLSDVLETSLIPAPLGSGATATILFTKYIPKNATFLVVDVYQYNTEDWMNNICVMCDTLKASPTRMFIPIAQRADLAITGVSFDAVTGQPQVSIKNISEIPFEMENAGELSWAYFYENGEMKNSKFGKMNFLKKFVLPGASFEVPLPSDAKLSYGVSRMMVVYDTSSFFNPNSGKIISENVALYNKEVDVKNNIWIGDVPQPDIKIQSAVVENGSKIRVVFVNKGKQGFELCSGFSLCGRKVDIEYFNKSGKIVAKNQGMISSSIKPGEVFAQEFLLDGSITLADISYIRIVHEFGSEAPSEKNGHIAYIFITDAMVAPPVEILEPTIFETIANSFKMLFAFTPEKKAEVALERVQLLERAAEAAAWRRDVKKMVETRTRLQSAVAEFSELQTEDDDFVRVVPKATVRNMIESYHEIESAEIKSEEVKLEDRIEQVESREVKKEERAYEVVPKQRPAVEDEQEEHEVVLQKPEWQKFREEQIEAIDKAYAEVVMRKNRLTARENVQISRDWSAAQDLFERARRSMGEYASVERQQELFTRVQIDAARQLKIMDELVH